MQSFLSLYDILGRLAAFVYSLSVAGGAEPGPSLFLHPKGHAHNAHAHTDAYDTVFRLGSGARFEFRRAQY